MANNEREAAYPAEYHTRLVISLPDASPSAGNHPRVSSEGSPEGGPGVPTSQEEAILELAEACRKDSGALSLSPEEVKELIGLAVAVVHDPSAPLGQRI